MPPPLSVERRFAFFSRRFLSVWATFAFVLLALAYGAGLAPTAVSELGDRAVALFIGDGGAGARATSPAGVAGPPRIVVPAIGLAAPIVFPESSSLGALNEALTRGTVHYPGSALPGEPGTVFLFGHSTGLAVVHNKNFEVFNRLPELSAGDTIRLSYGGREHWYRVRSVELKLTDAAAVDLSPSGDRRLVLITCNVFGGVDDRFIVTAEFVRSYPLQQA